MKFNKLFHTVILTIFSASYIFAQIPPQPEDGDGTGASGTGTPASPIDMYVYLLAIAAMLFIVYYARRTAASKVH